MREVPSTRTVSRPNALPTLVFRFAGRLVRVGQAAIGTRRALDVAAAIAFWFFLSLVPLLVLVGFVVGQVARSRGVDALVEPLLEVAPPSAEGLVRKEVERLADGSASLAPFGMIGYLWTASAGLHNLMDIFEVTGQATRRAWWKKRAIALAWVLLGLATTCAMAVLLVKVDATLHAHLPRSIPRPAGARHHNHPAHTPLEQAFAGGLTLLAGTLLLGGFYRFAVEHPAHVRRRVWPGTLTAVACWLVVSWAFGAYVVSIADYALYYGSLAAVAVLLIWLYLTSLSLVVGAELNAQLESTRAAKRRAPTAS